MTYDFTNRTKTTLIAGMAIGLLCLVLTWFGDDSLHTRFWANFLHNAAFFTGIGLMAAFFMSVSITAWAGWYVVFKRVWEAMSLFLIIGCVLIFIMGLSNLMGWNHLYHWNFEGITEVGNENYDKLIAGKAGFLNKYVYLIGSMILMVIWTFIVMRIRSLSLSEEGASAAGDFSYHYSKRKWAALFLPLAGFGSAFVVWQWIMSIDAHWYSTMFAWYTGASWFVSMIALTILILLFLKGQGYYKNVTTEHFHDLGKFLFAFSIFWTYVWFSQYMLIWYANVGEETIYFRERVDNYNALFWLNILINFIAPFFILMRNDTKRKMGSLGFAAGLVLVGHWLDFFLMIRPGVRHTAHEAAGHGHGHEGHGHEAGHGAHDATHGAHDAAHEAAHGGHDALHAAGDHASGLPFELGFTFPGFLELGAFLGFLCLFLYFVLNRVASASLTSDTDPYLQESIHHHT